MKLELAATSEKQQNNSRRTSPRNTWKTLSERKACGQKWLQHYVYRADKCALHIHIT